MEELETKTAEIKNATKGSLTNFLDKLFGTIRHLYKTLISACQCPLTPMYNTYFCTLLLHYVYFILIQTYVCVNNSKEKHFLKFFQRICV